MELDRWWPASRVLRTCALVLLCLSPLLSAESVGAQSIQGRLLDEASGEAVAGAVVTLLDRSKRALRTVTTADDGAFVLGTPHPGRFHLRTSRIGYAEVTTGPLDVRADELVEVEISVPAEAILLAPLEVLSDRPALVLDGRLERWGYYERKEHYGTRSGFGHFLDREDLDRRILSRASQLFQDMPGMRVTGAGGRRVEVTGRAGCSPVVYLDGARIRGDPDLIVPTSDLVAVEVYPGMVHPVRFSAGDPRCGMVLFWTGVR